ncbi:MAG: hypothetical protein COA78_23205 [Blastopirellula sp.]|nr:MAG: hypothetical protein COA78_23205 [Blastopirellula sp.]
MASEYELQSEYLEKVALKHHLVYSYLLIFVNLVLVTAVYLIDDYFDSSIFRLHWNIDLYLFPPLGILCLLVALGPGTVWQRVCLFGVSLAVISIFFVIPFPQQYDASGSFDLYLVLSTACLLLLVLGSYSRLRVGPAQLQSQKVTLSGILIAMTMFFLLIELRSQMGSRNWAPLPETITSEFDPLVIHRLQSMLLLVIGSPILTAIIFFSARCGTKWYRLMLVPLPVGAIALAYGMNGPITQTAEALSFFIAITIPMAWTSANVLLLTLFGWHFSRRT